MWNTFSSFVHTMQEGDIVLITNNDYVYIGTVGPYYYEKEFHNNEDTMCHKWKFTLLKVIGQDDLDESVKELIRNRGAVTK